MTLQKRLKAEGAAARGARGARLDEFAAELQQIAALCKGKLEPVKPLLEEALAIARGRRPAP